MFKAPKTRWAVVHASNMRATRRDPMCAFPILAMHEKKSRTVAPESALCQLPWVFVNEELPYRMRKRRAFLT
jgi:hypothetical protein